MTELIPEPQGDPGGLESYASQLSAAAGRIEGLASRTISVTGDIKSGADWTGDAADGFSGFAASLAHGVGGTESHLSRIASAVRNYAGHLRSAKARVQAYNKAAEAASCLAGKKRHEAIAALAGIRKDAEAAVKAAKAAGDQAASEVGDSADGVLTSAADVVETGSSAVDKYDKPITKLVGRRVESAKRTAEEADKLEQDLPGLLEQSKAENPAEAARLEGISSALQEWNLGRAEKAAVAVSRGTKVLSFLSLAAAPAAIPEGVDGMLHPEDKGAAGVADRVVSGGNAVSGTTDTVLGIVNLVKGASYDVPYLGEVTMGANVIWTGENWLYKNSKVGHDVIYAVGHSEIEAGKWTWDAGKNAGNWVKGTASTLGHKAGSAGSTIWNDGKGLVNDIGHIHIHFP